MSERVYSYTVTLDGVYKDEDAESIKSAIEMIKGVSSVIPEVVDPRLFFALDRARNEIADKIMDIIYPKKGD